MEPPSVSSFKEELSKLLRGIEEQLIQQHENGLAALRLEMENGSTPSTLQPNAEAAKSKVVAADDEVLEDEKESPFNRQVSPFNRQVSPHPSNPMIEQLTPHAQGHQEQWAKIVYDLLQHRRNGNFIMKHSWQSNLHLLSQHKTLSRKKSLSHRASSRALVPVEDKKQSSGSLDLVRGRVCTAIPVIDMSLPSSKLSLLWAAVCLSLVVKDMVIVPITISFDCFDGWGAVPEFEVWFSRLWWTADIVMTFRTGAYKNGEVVMNPYDVTRQYLTSWFLFDFALALGEWLQLFLDDISVRHSSVMRCFKLYKYLRVLRFSRAQSWMFEIMRQLSPGTVIIFENTIVSLFFALIMLHLQACAWYKLGWSDKLKKGDPGTWDCDKIQQAYLHSLHSVVFQELSTGESPAEFSFAISCLLINITLWAWFFSKLVVVSIELSDSHTFYARMAAYRYTEAHDLSPAVFLLLTKSLKTHEQRWQLQKDHAREVELFKFFPEDVQRKIHTDARALSLRGFPFMHDEYVHRHEYFIQQVCHETVTDQLCFQDDLVFEEDRRCTRMLCIDSASLHYFLSDEFKSMRMESQRGKALSALMASRGNDDHADVVEVDPGDCLCEASLWTKWTHRGDLMTIRDGRMLSIDSEQFSQIVTEQPEICFAAVQYARHCVAQLNRPEILSSDLHTYEFETACSGSELWATTDSYLIFISHYKAEAGTEATLMMTELEVLIRVDPFNPACNYELPVFVDSEGLDDLDKLCDYVKKSHNVVLLLTPGVFFRIWCLIELVTASRSKVDILPVEVQRPGVKFEYPDDEFYSALRSGEHLSEADLQLLSAQGVTLAEVEEVVRNIFKKIARPFSPTKSNKVRSAEMIDILKHCPCNEPEELGNRSSRSGKSVLTKEEVEIQDGHGYGNKKWLLKRSSTLAEMETEMEMRDADRLRTGGAKEQLEKELEEQRRSGEAELLEEHRKSQDGLIGGILQSLSHGIEGQIEAISPIIKGQIQDVEKGISGISL